MAQAPVQLTQEQFQQLLGQLNAPGDSRSANVKPTRPSVDIDTTEGEWSVFEDNWARFKRMSKLTSADDIRDNLRQCCSPPLNKRLFDVKGNVTLNAATENDLLSWMKEIAVKGVHTEVHRTQFVSLKQRQGESINSFYARLKSESSLCNFRVPAPANCSVQACECTNHGMNISYQDDMVATQLVAGLYNNEHQSKILADSVSLHTLDDKLKRLLILEKSDASLTSLVSNDGFTHAVWGKKQTFNKQSKLKRGNWAEKCPLCQKKHPKCTKCNGYHKCTTKCNLCQGMGHIRNCCPSSSSVAMSQLKNTIKDTEDTDTEKDVAFEFQVTAENTITQKKEGDTTVNVTSPSLSISNELISHMEYINQMFVRTNPHDAPFMEVTCRLMPDDHKKFGRHTPQHKDVLKLIRLKGLADTGAQICTSGLELLASLGIDEAFLVPTSMAVKGVTHSPMTVLGALFLEISAHGRSTKQIVYIASEARTLILSEKALQDLGVIPSNFPSADMLQETSINTVNSNKLSNCKSKCGCLLRRDVPALPATIPFEPTENNKNKLERWILEYYASSAFNTCEHQQIPQMTGPGMIIRIEDDTMPTAIHSPIPVPHHWKKKVKEDIDRDCKLGVIEPVPAGTPTTWCSRMIVTAKQDGSPRRVVDLQTVNKVSKRETHHTPSPWNLVSSVPPNKKKTVLDAWNGYHSIPLDTQSRHKTTFITEWGRYRYCRAPQGFTASGDAYTKRFDDITCDVPNVTRCVDDSIMWEDTIQDSFWATCRYIDLCVRNGIIFNPRKFKFGRDIVDFAGFTIAATTVKPTAAMIQTIKDFPTPTSITGARGWFGLVNQVAYAFAQSKIMAPFRELLQKNKKFYWDSTLDDLFRTSKEDIIQRIEEGVQMYEMGRPTCLTTDWSKSGIGFFLLQKYCRCDTDKGPHCGPGHWKLVFSGSRFLKDAETRYSPIEGEALAVVYALEQTRMFVLGCPNLILAIDHKPLVPILNDKRLDTIKNPRLLNLKERTLMYRFHATHIPGKLNFAPDAASRNPVAEMNTCLLQHSLQDNTLKLDDEAIVNAIKSADDDVVSWQQVKAAAAKDDICMSLCDAIRTGFPQKKSEAAEFLRPYYKLQYDLHCIEGVPCLGYRMFIPKILRRKVLTVLHSAHQGVSGMKNSTHHRFWWLGMDADIDQVRAQCRECNGMAPSNTNDLMADPPEPEYPWQLTVMDYFDVEGYHYLVIADRYTGWPEIYRQDGKAMTLVKTCRKFFTQFGVPEEIATDGGPPFNSYEWSQFLTQWGISHRESSANYPQSNGRAELAVKSCKRMLRGNTVGGRLDTAKVAHALLQYRNTPVSGVGMSPAYMLYGRQLRDALPTLPNTLKPTSMSCTERYGDVSDVWKDIQHCREVATSRKQAKTIEQYNAHKQPLAALNVGDCASIQNRSGPRPLRWDRTGRVVERLANRQYLVKADGSGRILLRTRTHLRKINPITSDRSAYDVNLPVKLPDTHDVGHQPLHIPGQLRDGTTVLPPIEPEDVQRTVQTDETDRGVEPEITDSVPECPLPAPDDINMSRESVDVPPTHQAEPEVQLRRSTRAKKRTELFSPLMHGKSHEKVQL